MFKGKLIVLSLIAAALLSWQIMPAGVGTANSGIVEPCSSTASSGAACMLLCPAGDGTRLDLSGGTVSVTVKDNTGAPVAGIPAADFWLTGWSGGLTLCGGAGSSNANLATNALGQTLMIGTIAAGGCDLGGLSVVVQGVILQDPATNCTTDLCLAITSVSPDINGDLIVQLIDLAQFGPVFLGTVALNLCMDFNCDGIVNLVDLALLGAHWQHVC